MRTVFADTFFFLALLDSREAFHRQASQFSRDSEVQIVTTEWVLAEFGNAYSDPRDRADFVSLYRILIVHPRVKIIPAQTSLFQSGIELFAERADKEWSLVDCILFCYYAEGRPRRGAHRRPPLRTGRFHRIVAMTMT